MPIKFYYDFLSQPSRALYMLLKISGVNFQKNPVDLRSGAHYTEEYEKINRFQRVPVIDHDGFVLTESIAIIRYLAKCGMIPDSLYPADLQKQARVDEFLEWHHIGLRVPCAMYFRTKVIDPMFTGKPPKAETLKNFEKRMLESLDLMESKWLGRGHAYLVGDKLTVADIIGISEVEQPRMAGFDPTAGRPNLTQWIAQVQNDLSPHYEEANIVLNKIAKKAEGQQSKL